MKNVLRVMCLAGALAAGIWGCVEDGGSVEIDGRGVQRALDDVGVPPEGVSLVLLDDGAEETAVASKIESLGGTVFQLLAPRLIVARIPDGADPILAEMGMAERFERAVDEDEIPGASVEEARFARVFGNRCYPAEVPPGMRLAIDHAVRSEGEAWEEAASADFIDDALARSTASRASGSPADEAEAESWFYVPYASGTVVVSVWLPESNGVSEPSTEDWSEEMITATYAKIQAALEAVKRHDANSDLRFVLHYESRPANGGLEGTIDHDWEFGKQAGWGAGSNEYRSDMELLSTLLGTEVTDFAAATHEYMNGLRDLYGADGVFVVKVAANGNYTAGLRAHAYLNGPYTTLDSTADWTVFLHEFGHIFGAGDEYCPDACWSPTSQAGYLSVINANAQYYDDGTGPGINGGRGENQPSLMIYNAANEVNGYTRGQWGWIDADGDGVEDVRDTFPSSADLTVSYFGPVVKLSGVITDVPARRTGATPFSANRIDRLEYRFTDVADCPWFSIPVFDRSRGRASVELSLGALPTGVHALEIRAVNSVGNAEPAPRTIAVTGLSANTAPRVALGAPFTVGSTETRFPLRVDAVDLEGDAFSIAIDLDGDGVFETPVEDGSALDAIPTPTYAPGRHTVGVEATDEHGLSRQAQLELDILDANAAPRVAISGASSPFNGSASADLDLRAEGAVDPEGQAIEFNWIVEMMGHLGAGRAVESGFGPDDTYTAHLSTPGSLNEHALDTLFADAPDLNAYEIADAELLDENTVALAMGKKGLAIVDLSDRKAPAVLSRIDLETSVYDIWVKGARLYALGGQLAVVDISNRRRPVELKQHFATTDAHVSTNGDAQPVYANDLAVHKHVVEGDEKISDVQVRVTVSHPDHSKLEIMLEGDKEVGIGNVVILPLGASARHGVHTYAFTTVNTPALRQILGKFTGGGWAVMVRDEGSAGGEAPVGTLSWSRVRFATRHRAFEPIEGASLVLGTSDKNHLVVAGDGVEVLDISYPQWIDETGRVPGDPIVNAALANGRVVAGTNSAEKPEEIGASLPGTFSPYAGYVEGLAVVDVRAPYFPRVIFENDDVAIEELAVIGGRYYARTLNLSDEGNPYVAVGDTKTLVGDLAGLLAGHSSVLGATDAFVSRDAFAVDDGIWSRNLIGGVSRLDASDPANVNESESFIDPWFGRMDHLGGEVIFAYQWCPAYIIDLNDRENIISSVFQITLEARDAAGAVGRSVRYVHVVPYSHDPAIAGVDILAGSDVEDTWQFGVRVEDPDGEVTWDPYLYAAADLDGDGILETSWQPQYAGDDAAVFTTRFSEPGTYRLSFAARDGFWGVAKAQSIAVEVPPHADVPCGGGYGASCGADEYCSREGEGACDDGTVGVCRELYQECPGEEILEVCGCDGNSYKRACDAAYWGVNVAAEGACEEPEDCTTTGCDDGFYCVFCFVHYTCLPQGAHC